MDKVFVAKGVADQLVASERALDAAMIEANQLISSMLKARQEMNLGATVGSTELAKVAEAQAGLEAARAALATAHHGLDELRLRVGIRTSMTGAYKPQQGRLTEEDRVRSFSA